MNFQGSRTKYFDTYFRAAAAAGVRQIVLLAAGLDSRAYRLDWPRRNRGVRARPATGARVQARRARRTEHAHRANAARSPSTFAMTGRRPCGTTDSTRRKPSAWIVEGLLIYLPAAAQRQLFTGIDTLSAPGSHAAVEDAVPLGADTFAARLAEERASPRRAGQSVDRSSTRLQRAERAGRAVVRRPRLANRGHSPGRTICARTGDPRRAPMRMPGPTTISLVTAVKR